jgi:hypothetical protein
MALTWSDIEAKFRELEDDLPYTRVDAHWGGSDGEQWQLAGPFDPSPRQSFETVARLAGNKTRGELADHPDLPDAIINESDPVVRWYKAIWKLVGGFRFDYRDQPKADGVVHQPGVAVSYRFGGRALAEGVTAQPPRAVQRSSSGRALPIS